MEPGRILLRRGVALSLLGQHMHQYCVIHPARLFEGLNHSFDVVAVHRAKVRYAHIFKEHARNHQLLDAVLGAADFLYQPGPYHRNFKQGFRYLAFKFVVAHARTQAT